MPDRSDKDLSPCARRVLTQHSPSLRGGLAELLRAHELALDARHSKWDFAVEIHELRRRGLTDAQLRWLVCKEIVEHACEVPSAEGRHRGFRPTNALKFKKHTCFVLTAQFVKQLHENGTDRGPSAVMRHPGIFSGGAAPSPRWIAGSHELLLGSALVKRFKLPAQNQEIVLASFEEEHWPRSGIDDPLPPRAEHDPKQRLRDTIKCLNRYQENCYLRFRGDGSGQRVMWEFTKLALADLEIDEAALSPESRRKSS